MGSDNLGKGFGGFKLLKCSCPILSIPDCQRPTGAVLQSSAANEGRTAPKNKDELGYTARRKIKREERKGGGKAR